jgi:hypothetical protein
MYRAIFILAATMMISACGGEGSTSGAGDDEAGGEHTTPTEKNSVSKSNGPRWEIAIEGLPEKSGNIITAVAAGMNGQYNLGRSGFTASFSVKADDPAAVMMISFNEEDVRCFNGGEASVIPDGNRAVLSGEVKCMPKSGGEEHTAAIKGWFELKK